MSEKPSDLGVRAATTVLLGASFYFWTLVIDELTFKDAVMGIGFVAALVWYPVLIRWWFKNKF